jgi:hypothetical protein
MGPALMARASARVVLNRAALTELGLALAVGVEEIVHTIVETARPPDEPILGLGLVKEGGWAVYAGSKKVGGGSLDGTQPRKPRALETPPGMITGVAGFGFPARFNEIGTAHQPGRPFFAPQVVQVIPVAPAIMRDTVGPILKGRS